MMTAMTVLLAVIALGVLIVLCGCARAVRATVLVSDRARRQPVTGTGVLSPPSGTPAAR